MLGKEFGMMARDLFGGVGRAHAYQAVGGPQTGDQFWEEPRIPGHDCRYFIRAADRPPVRTSEQGKNVCWRHDYELSATSYID